MNDILKQRLVGALILVALGVVFWPIVFVEPGDRSAAQQPGIPPRPKVDTAPIEAPDLAGLRGSPKIAAQTEAEPSELSKPPEELEAQAPAMEKMPLPVPAESDPAPVVESETERTRSEAPAKLVIDSDGVPVAWILQVASVSSADTADTLRQRLLKMDRKAYVKKVNRGSNVLYRVYIGPKFERAILETMQADIDAEFGVKSMIARYIP